MKKSKTFFAYAMLAALASCSNDHVLSQQSPAPSDPDVINIVAASSKAVTRAAQDAGKLQDTQFDDNELINVYLEENLSGGSSATTTYQMLRYKVTNTTPSGGSGKVLDLVSTTPAQQTPHYPLSGNGIDAFAFYPALETVNGYDVKDNTNTFSVAENQSVVADYRKSDLMFGTNNPTSSSSFPGTKKTNPVNLHFKHLLSKIIVKLKPGDGLNAANLIGATVKLYNAYPKASITPSKTGITVNVDNGTPAPATGYVLTTDYASTESTLDPGTYPGCACIIIPQNINVPVSHATPTKFIEVTLSSANGGAKYIYNIEDKDTTPTDNIMKFEQGNSYTYTIKLSAGNVVVVSTKIDNWNNTNIDGTADLEDSSAS